MYHHNRNTGAGRASTFTYQHALQLADQAERWAEYASQHSSFKSETIYKKALSSLVFSLRTGTRSLAIPSKRRAVRAHQEALAALHEMEVSFATPLALDVYEERLVVSYGFDALGEISTPHSHWLREMLPYGVKPFLLGITGMSRQGWAGCNIVLGRVGAALDLMQASGGDGVAQGTPDMIASSFEVGG